METRRLEVLLDLARLGSMRAVADARRTTTSTVSQQVAALARETGVALVEPAGRQVRLTPAGRRLAEHAVRILAAVDTARRDLDPDAEPSGTVRVAGFATVVRTRLLPMVADLARTHPRVRLLVREQEPAEARHALVADAVDLALTYDYDLAPAPTDPTLAAEPLGTAPWGLGVPAGDAARVPAGADARTVVAAFRDHDWVVNSRNRADADVARVLAGTAGFEPRLAHEADSLELVDDLVAAGLGVGLLPADRVPGPGVVVLRLRDPGVTLRAHAVTRPGRAAWPPLALVLDRLRTGRAAPGPPDPAPDPAPAPRQR